jgi:CBS domain-containing protein
MVLKLKDIMTTEVVSVGPETTLRQALELLSEQHISGLPVVSGGRAVGVFTSTDLLDFLAEYDEGKASAGHRLARTPLDEVMVSEIMTRMVHSLPPECSVEDAAAFMRDAQIHRVMVMKGGELVGIVTTTDVAKAVAEHRIGRRSLVFG